MNKSTFSIHNEMMIFMVVQLIYLGLIYYYFGNLGLICALSVGVVGFLLLETINYIETLWAFQRETRQWQIRKSRCKAFMEFKS